MKEIYLVPCAICDGSAEGSFEVVGRSDLMGGELPISKLNICVACLSRLLDDLEDSAGRAFESYGIADYNPEHYNAESITSHWKARPEKERLSKAKPAK